MDRANNLDYEYSRPRWDHRRFRLYKDGMSAFANLFKNFQEQTPDQSRRSRVPHDAERFMARQGCGLASSTSADNASRNRFCTIPINALRTAGTYHTHSWTTKPIEKNSVKQSRIHKVKYGALIEHHMIRSSNLRHLVW